MRPAFGTLEWGDKNNGVLTRTERLHFLRNMAFLAARDTHAQDLLSHAYRTYYFGAMLAAYRKLRYDREAHFAAAILHDIGLTESRIAPLKQCCFAVSGGRQARDFLLGKHHSPEQAQVIGDAIS